MSRIIKIDKAVVYPLFGIQGNPKRLPRKLKKRMKRAINAALTLAMLSSVADPTEEVSQSGA